MQIFGRPAREKTCDCERSNEPSVAQALYLVNDEEIVSKLNSPTGRLPELVKSTADIGKAIEELYLASLSRFPTADELALQMEHVEKSPSREAGLRDVLWSLLNVREFVFNHQQSRACSGDRHSGERHSGERLEVTQSVVRLRSNAERENELAERGNELAERGNELDP